MVNFTGHSCAANIRELFIEEQNQSIKMTDTEQTEWIGKKSRKVIP
ncbi:hypothetical protein [Acetobacteroides hydrogenigenes]|nr:hypothetical protein [Acetobacteroides hydrogenigenes]